jgi:hypothetical protein
MLYCSGKYRKMGSEKMSQKLVVVILVPPDFERDRDIDTPVSIPKVGVHTRYLKDAKEQLT